MFCVILASRLNQIVAVCCPTTVYKYCSTWCCGKGACNIFCCNCGHGYRDGGCNHEYWVTYKWMNIYQWCNKGYPDGYVYDRDYKISRCGDRREDRSIVNETAVNDYFMERLLKDTKELFQKIDVDGDNFLTLEESEFYLKNYKGLKRSTSDNSLEKDIMRIDINNDGLISPKEFDESL